MFYKSFALLAIIFAFVTAVRVDIAKRDDFINDEDGILKLICKLKCVIIKKNKKTNLKASLGPNDQDRHDSY